MCVGGLTGALFVQLNYKITLFRRRYSILYITYRNINTLANQTKTKQYSIFSATSTKPQA